MKQEKRIYKKRRHQGVVGDFRWPNMCAAGVPENRKSGEEQKKTFEEIIAHYFLNLMKVHRSKKLKAYETQRSLH